MAWQASFKSGISSFQAGRYEESLSHFNKGIELETSQYLLYDSRAAVFDKLNRPKDALRDAKTVISLAPERLQGYLRSARIFIKAQRCDAALTMIEHAYERIANEDTKRRTELDGLKAEALRLRDSRASSAASVPTQTSGCHFGRLPVEICTEIFQQVVWLDHARVITLSHVCKQWRAVALNSVALWRTLILTKRRPAAKMRLWIERSRATIRELHVRPEVANEPDLPSALQQLSWQALRVLRVENHAISLLIHAPFSQLSNLEELDISSHQYRGPTTLFLIGCIGRALRSLSLEGFNLVNQEFSPETTNLVSLVLRRVELPRIDTFLDFLMANSALECLILDHMRFRQYVPIDDNALKIHLPFLTRLEMTGNLQITLSGNIIFPSLQKLIIQSRLFIDEEFFSSQPMTSLTELRIRDCPLPVSLLAFLRNSSSLETIQLSGIAGDVNSYVEALEVTEHHRPCPSLTDLDFSVCHQLTSGPIIRLIKSRLPTISLETSDREELAQDSGSPRVARIKSLILDNCPLIDSEILPWLRSNVAVVRCVYMTRKQARLRR